jgi:hypothetical protein
MGPANQGNPPNPKHHHDDYFLVALVAHRRAIAIIETLGLTCEPQVSSPLVLAHLFQSEVLVRGGGRG